jgi:hypothetical protein
VLLSVGNGYIMEGSSYPWSMEKFVLYYIITDQLYSIRVFFLILFLVRLCVPLYVVFNFLLLDRGFLLVCLCYLRPVGLLMRL